MNISYNHHYFSITSEWTNIPGISQAAGYRHPTESVVQMVGRRIDDYEEVRCQQKCKIKG